MDWIEGVLGWGQSNLKKISKHICFTISSTEITKDNANPLKIVDIDGICGIWDNWTWKADSKNGVNSVKDNN